MRQRLLIFGGLLLAAALATGGQALFRPDMSFPISKAYAWPLATIVTLVAIILFAILSPRRADDPGLGPYPTPALPAFHSESPITAAAPSADEAGFLLGTTALPRLGLRQMLRVGGVVLAIALSYLSVLIFQRKLLFLQWPEGRLLLAGSAVTVAGMVLFGLLGPRPDPTDAPGELPVQERPTIAPMLARPWFLGWFAVVFGLYGYAMGYYQGAGETRAVVLAWAISMVLLLVATISPQVVRSRRRWLPPRAEGPWLLALLGILAVALVLRTVRLTTLPYDLDGDFASYGVQARAFITGPDKRLFTVGWANIPMIGYLPPVFTMLLFGTGQVGLNMSGVIEGMLSIVGVYLLGRDFFSRRIGLLAAAISTVLYVHVHFSRVSAYMDPLPFMVFGLYFLLRGLRHGSAWVFTLSGILFAFGFLMYYSGRSMFVIAALWIIYLVILRPRWIWARWQGLALTALGFFIALGPMLIYFIRDRESLVERSRSVFLFYPPVVQHLFNKYNVTTMSALIWEQVKRTLLMFHYYIDTSTQMGLPRPFLDPFTAPLLALGVGYALFRLRRQAYAFTLLWFTVVLVVGCMLTSNAPFWPRLVPVLPPVALLIALAVDRIVGPVEAWLKPRFGRAATQGITVFLVAGIAFVGYANWRVYDYYKGTWATARTLIARYMAAQDAGIQAWMIYDPFSYKDREFDFLVPGRFQGDLTREQVQAGELPVFTGPGLFIITPNHTDLLPLLEQRYPAGMVITHRGNAPAEKAFYIFKVPPGG